MDFEFLPGKHFSVYIQINLNAEGKVFDIIYV